MQGVCYTGEPALTTARRSARRWPLRDVVRGSVPPRAAAPAPPSLDAVQMPDPDTEARLNRLVEDDIASSRQRVRERQERRAATAPPSSEPTGGDAPVSWHP